MNNKRFLNVQDVARFMGISVPRVHKTIHQLNSEPTPADRIYISG